MSGYATKEDVQTIVNKAVDDLSDVIANLAQTMHGEILETRQELREIRFTINQLTNTIDGFVGSYRSLRD